MILGGALFEHASKTIMIADKDIRLYVGVCVIIASKFIEDSDWIGCDQLGLFLPTKKIMSVEVEVLRNVGWSIFSIYLKNSVSVLDL